MSRKPTTAVLAAPPLHDARSQPTGYLPASSRPGLGRRTPASRAVQPLVSGRGLAAPLLGVIPCLALLAGPGMLQGVWGAESPQTQMEAELPPLPEADLTSLPEALRAEALAMQARARQSPRDADAAGSLGILYLAHELHRAAGACFERATRIAPGVMRWHYYLGLARVRTGQPAAAIAALQRAVELDPSYEPIVVELADLLMEVDPNRAPALYERAARLDPADPAAHLGLGKCARAAGRRDEAIAHFRRAIAIYPDYAEAHYALAMDLAAEGLQEEAKGHLKQHATGSAPPLDRHPLRRAIVEVSDSAGALRKQADYLARSGDIESAVRLLERAIEIDVSGSTSRIHLGLLRARQGRFQEAAEQFRRALKADPGSVEAKSSLALALTELQQFDEALRLYREVLAQHPRHAPTHVYLGHLLSRMGQTAEALEHLERGVEYQPGNGLFQYTLGELLAKADRGSEAILHLRKAVQLLPEHPAARQALGNQLARSGDMAGARLEWQVAVRLSPGLADSWAGLSGIALGDGDPEEAVRLAERACSLTGYSKPDHLEALARAYEAAGRGEDAGKVRRRIQQPK